MPGQSLMMLPFGPRAPAGGWTPPCPPGPSPGGFANFSLYFLAARAASEPFPAALQVAGVGVAVTSCPAVAQGSSCCLSAEEKTRKSIHELEIEIEATKQMSNYLSRWCPSAVCLLICSLLEQPAACLGSDCLGMAAEG